MLLERVELLEVGLHARVCRVDAGRRLERLPSLSTRLRVARERGREIDPCARELRIESQRLAVLRDRVRDPPFELEGVAEVRMEGGALRIELDRLLQLGDRPREIALREVAESVDRSVSANGAEGDVARRAAASERVMVCLPTRQPPHGAMLLRQGSRLAGRLNTEWFSVHVETKQAANHRIDATLQRYLLDDEQRARDLGAEVVRLRSEKPVEALLEFGRAHGVRHIVVGRSHKAWWRRLLGQSPIYKLVTQAAGFDLHIVSLEEQENKE